MEMRRCSPAALLMMLATTAAPRHSAGAVLLAPSMRTFGNALKSFAVKGTHEQLLLNFSSPPAPGSSAPHVITEQWFSLFGSAAHAFDPNTDARIRIYIDEEVVPSLDFQLFFAHTVGLQNCVNETCSDTRVPWASSEVQHMAHAGALKNRYRIPFTRTIRITATLPHDGIIYYYCRGMTHLPVVVGDLQLPDAARLKLHKNWGVVVQPLEQLPLLPPRTNSSGLLYATIWSAESEFIGFMEGCVRATADDQLIFLSSGTEDYFESANFFNAGHPVDDAPGAFPWPNASMVARNNLFTSASAVSAPESGVGYLNGTNPKDYSMSAYKFHLSDPIVWWDSFTLTASNYDGGGEDPALGGAMGCRGAAEGTKPLGASSNQNSLLSSFCSSNAVLNVNVPFTPGVCEFPLKSRKLCVQNQ